MIAHITAICMFLSHVVCYPHDVQSPVIDIPQLGSVRGNYIKSYFTKRQLQEFLGINYAEPPSGDRRFRPPVPSGRWSDVYNATKMRQRCPQVDQAYYPSPDPDRVDVKKDIEDCLVVNVYTPDIKLNKVGMPVMFYIHGGSFYLGSAYDFQPNFLLEEDIVLVVPQYRLGPLGFMSLNTTDIPGNMGMLDILLALRWVKKHIHSFGGDPSKITVVGQSAGAAAASSLLFSPLVENDLFDKLIIQSGSILSLWAVDANPTYSAKSIAKIVGCQTDSLNKMTECLKAVPALDLVKAHGKFLEDDMKATGIAVGRTGLVVQGEGPGHYLERHPLDWTSRRTRMPVMGGTVRDEGTTFYATFCDQFRRDHVVGGRYFERNATADVLKFFGFKDDYGVLNDAFQNLYFGTRLTQLKDMYPGLVDMSGVLVMKQSTYNLLRSLSYKTDTYAYSFDFYGGVSKLRASEPEWNKLYPFPAGVGHSDELGYLFPSSIHNYTLRELDLVRTMTKLWTNFVRFGNPVTSDTDISWPPMLTEYGPYLRISDNLEIRDNILEEFTIATKDGFLSGCSPSASISLLCILFVIGFALM